MSYLRTFKTVIFFCFIILFLYNTVEADDKSVFNNFISVEGDKLYEGDSPFRFISFNIPNLLCIEDNMSFTEKNAWRLPDLFEIEDALKSIQQMGGSVARTYVITVHRENDTPDIPRYVLGPGEFNEEAFNVLDQVLASANRIGIRLIIPFVDNWKWMGGKPQYAKFRNKNSEQFWSDKTIKSDFKKTISFMLNRVNTITGISYKNDKAILAWELGNELQTATTEWISEMARYIKTIDSNHLVNDGIQKSRINDEVLINPDIDILSTHHYEKTPLEMLNNIKISTAKAKGKKPYYIGEFGFISTSGVESILNYVRAEQSISGALIWSLRFHNRDGGFYWHSEPMGSGLYKAYHIPGFYSGNSYDEINLLKVMKENAFTINDRIEKKIKIPEAPHLLPIKDVAHISWQGAVGANRYRIERSLSVKGKWESIGQNISDASVAYAPLFNDRQAELNKSYFYRVFALNDAGSSTASNVIGPVLKTQHTLVDEMNNYGKIYNYRGKLILQTENTRNFKEDSHRMGAEEDTEIIYYVPGNLKSCLINIFIKDKSEVIKFSVSTDGKKYHHISSESKNFFTGESDYQYWQPVQIKAENIVENYHYLKLKFINSGQIGRVEIRYAN